MLNGNHFLDTFRGHNIRPIMHALCALVPARVLTNQIACFTVQ